MQRFLYLWILLDLIGMGFIVLGALQLSGIAIPMMGDQQKGSGYAIALILIGLLLAVPLIAAIVQRAAANKQ